MEGGEGDTEGGPWSDGGMEGGRTGPGKFNDLYICVVLVFMKWN